RARFIGRGRSTANPAALESMGPLSASTGPVRIPTFSTRRRGRTPPRNPMHLASTLGAPPTRTEAFWLPAPSHHLRSAGPAFDHLPLVRQLLVAHEYLRLKGLAWDLVILNEHPPSYLQSFDEALHEAARSEGSTLDQPGGVFIRRAELLPDAGRNLLLFVARA